MIQFYKFLKQAIFLLKLYFIISSEVFIYLFLFDYYYFIERITNRLASINILYVKVFQAIALNNNLIDEKINHKLLKFTDNAPWNMYDIRLDELIELCNDYDINLNEGFENPMNSGMISLVYKGYFRKNGENVIIKMKRNNIDNRLNDAIENLETFMYFISFIPIIKKYQISDVIIKNIDIIKHQTNFSEEVQNIEKVKKNCKGLKYVKIPYVYSEITEKYPNFILMEYIHGLKINEIKEEDYEPFAKQILKFGFVTTIVHGFAHGDLHGGNILFIKDNSDSKYCHKIGVIDFGIIFELDSTYRDFLFDLLTNMFDRSPEESALKIYNSNILEPPNIFNKIPLIHRENIMKFSIEMIEETIKTSKKANQLQIYKFFHKLKEYLNKSEISDIGIRPSDNLIKTQLVLAMAHGITLTLCKEDFMSLADKVINELFHTEIMIN
jgi:predicted unusual protein kinase regulating ubiquinone biosynthesis (AarF/ABC1/UbiB family)